MKITKYLFGISLIIGLSISLFPINVKGVSINIDFTFNKHILLGSDAPIDNHTSNLRNSGFYNGGYQATYSFENDINGATAVDWIKTGVENAYILQNKNGHEKVYKGNDTSANEVRVEQDFVSQQAYGSLEGWIQTNNADKFFQFRVNNDDDVLFVLAIDSDIWKYYDGGWNNLGTTAIDNIWYHVRLDFECTVGGYMDLAQWYFQFWVNGIDLGNSTFGTNLQPNKLLILTNPADSLYLVYWDAIGYSWDVNYDINDNFKPYFKTNPALREVKGYEFALEGIHDLIDIETDDPFNWEPLDSNLGETRVHQDPRQPITDRIVNFTTIGVNDVAGLSGNFSVEGTLIEVNFGFEITSITLDAVRLNFVISSLSGHQIVYFHILLLSYPFNLFYYDGSGYIWLGKLINRNVFYDFNFFIDYNSDTVSFDYFADGIHINNYIFPLTNLDKTGLGSTYFELDSYGAGGGAGFMDYINIYSDGIPMTIENKSINQEFGFITTNTNGEYYDEKEFNLFTMTGTGLFHTAIVGRDFDLDEEHYVIPRANISEGFALLNGSILYNTYDKINEWNYPKPLVIFTISGRGFNISSIYIEGVKLSEGINDYILEFEYSRVETNKSYFYVDSSHRLQFNLYSNESELEYIQATFNIIDVSTNNTAIGWKSLKNDIGFGYLRVLYETTSNVFKLTSHLDTKRILLENGYTINSFIILITDNAIPSITGLTTGYMKTIKLFKVDPIISFATQSLIFIIVPLILILLPTIIISERFGRHLIIPLFIMFSLICAIIELIPYWLFFITIISSSLFIFFKKKRNDV